MNNLEYIPQDMNLIYIKTGLDAIMVFIYSGTMGIGVIFSSVSLVVVQGFFTVLHDEASLKFCASPINRMMPGRFCDGCHRIFDRNLVGSMRR